MARITPEIINERFNDARYTVKENADWLRGEIKAIEECSRAFIEQIKRTDAAEFGSPNGKGECIGQATLAMRHVEDARMREGKVIQYAGDGESHFDKSPIERGQVEAQDFTCLDCKKRSLATDNWYNKEKGVVSCPECGCLNDINIPHQPLKVPQ